MTPLPTQPSVASAVSVRPASHRERGPRGRPRRAVEVPESQTHIHTLALLLTSCVTLGRWIPSLCSFLPICKTGQIWPILELKVECECKSVAWHLKDRSHPRSSPSSSASPWGDLGHVLSPVSQFPYLEVIRAPGARAITKGHEMLLVESAQGLACTGCSADIGH